MTNDLVKTLDRLATGASLSTQANKVLPAPQPTQAIPARTGSVTQTRANG